MRRNGLELDVVFHSTEEKLLLISSGIILC